MLTTTLNNDVTMPSLGFGVFQVPDAAECERAVTTSDPRGSSPRKEYT